MKSPFPQVWSYILLINTVKDQQVKLISQKKKLKHCPEKSYCSAKAAHHAHWCVSGVSVTMLIDSQANPSNRESEYTDFSLIPK